MSAATPVEDDALVRQLEPPGILGFRLGRRTPVSNLVSHVAFDLVLGCMLPHGA